MKSFILFSALITAFTISRTFGAAIITDDSHYPVEYIVEDPGDLPVEWDPARVKRSGSGDILGFVKNGIKSKLSQLAQASAGAVSHFSKHSSGGSGGGGGGYGVPTSYDAKSFDFWTLKKSILNTLLQAVKAIKGGVIAIKGQLIKGGGSLISAKGRLISMKGQAISNLGKHIISTAMLATAKPTPYVLHPDEIGPTGYSAPAGPIHHAPAPEHGSLSSAYGPPSGGDHISSNYGPPSSNYGAPIAPSSDYGAPISPSSDYGAPIAPSSDYGAPSPPASSYGVPAAPVSSYGAPSGPGHAYLPQKFNAALEGNYDNYQHQQYNGYY